MVLVAVLVQPDELIFVKIIVPGSTDQLIFTLDKLLGPVIVPVPPVIDHVIVSPVCKIVELLVILVWFMQAVALPSIKVAGAVVIIIGEEVPKRTLRLFLSVII